MDLDIFITMANNEPVLSKFFKVWVVIYFSILFILFFYAFLNFVAWCIQDRIYYKKWWIEKWNFIKDNLKKQFKNYFYPWIALLWIFAIPFQVPFFYLFLGLLEPILPVFKSLTLGARALIYLNYYFVFIIFCTAFFIIWVSYWKKSLLRTWLAVYIFWVVLCYAVPLLSWFFQTTCLDEQWNKNPNPALDSSWNVINCYDKDHNRDWKWVYDDEFWLYRLTRNYKNWLFDWYQFFHFQDDVIEWTDFFEWWVLLRSRHFYHDWQEKINAYFEDWLYKYFEFYENWDLKLEKTFSDYITQWNRISYDRNGNTVYDYSLF